MTSGQTIKWNPILLRAGLFLIGLGAFHIAVQIIWPRDWESAIGWRKPILFGVSTGATLVSLAWVAPFARARYEQLAAAVIAVLAVAEVLIITIQTWRGVPAHFNNGALVDRMLTNSVDAMLVFITLGIFYLTWETFAANWRAADYLLAARAGMIFLSLACLLGFATAAFGNYAISVNADSGIVQPRGVVKFVHGMPLHAIQILPVAAFALRFINDNLQQRLRSIWFLAGSIALATVYAAWQTLNGWARFELNFVGAALLGAIVISGATAAFCAIQPSGRVISNKL